MLTILLGTGVGVAVVLYTVKPRQISASQSFLSGVSSIETISLPSQSTFSQNDAAPVPEVTATQSQRWRHRSRGSTRSPQSRSRR